MSINLRTMGLGLVAATVVSLVGASTTFADPFYYGPQPVRPFVGPIGSPVRPHLGIMDHFQLGIGMVVDQVFPGSSADRMGLERGDVIHRINGHEIVNEWTYRHALNQAIQFDNGRVNLHVLSLRTGMRTVRTGFVNANPGFAGNTYNNGMPVRAW